MLVTCPSTCGLIVAECRDLRIARYSVVSAIFCGTTFSTCTGIACGVPLAASPAVDFCPHPPKSTQASRVPAKVLTPGHGLLPPEAVNGRRKSMRMGLRTLYGTTTERESELENTNQPLAAGSRLLGRGGDFSTCRWHRSSCRSSPVAELRCPLDGQTLCRGTAA